MKNFSASSLRLDTSLWTGLDLSAAFKDDDLLEDGIDIDYKTGDSKLKNN